MWKKWEGETLGFVWSHSPPPRFHSTHALSFSLSYTHVHILTLFLSHTHLTWRFTVQINSGPSSGPVWCKQQWAGWFSFFHSTALFRCFLMGRALNRECRGTAVSEESSGWRESYKRTETSVGLHCEEVGSDWCSKQAHITFSEVWEVLKVCLCSVRKFDLGLITFG